MALREYIVQEVALDCADGLLSRRAALRRLTLLGLSGTAAATLLAACGDDDSSSDGATTSTAGAGSGASQSSAPAGEGEEIRFDGPNGELIGVLSTGPEARGAVLVIHENRGLTDHIRSIPPRLAADGYTALAIDLLSAEGGTASLPSDEALAALGDAPMEQLVADLQAGLDELERRAPDAGLAAIGFCFGGGMTWELLAAGEPRLSAAVPFYGPFPDEADLSGSPNAAVLGIYAELDNRVNSTRPAAEEALDAAGLTYETREFEGAEHAFFNDTVSRHDPDAAAQAYEAMLVWFDSNLT